jgi:hypothetical protein
LRNTCSAWVRFTNAAGNQARTSDARPLVLHYDDWITAYQSQIWETLEPPATNSHDISVLSMMGRDNQITRAAAVHCDASRCEVDS